jgi:hypothetical protein
MFIEPSVTSTWSFFKSEMWAPLTGHWEGLAGSIKFSSLRDFRKSSPPDGGATAALSPVFLNDLRSYNLQINSSRS